MNRAWRRSSHQPLSHSRRQTITLYPGAQHRGRPESLDSRLSLPISIVGCPPRGAFSCLETRWLENAWTRNEKRQKETGSLAAPAHTPLALGLSVVEGQLDRWPCHRDASLLRMASRRRRSPAGRPRKKDMVNPPSVHGSRTLQKLLCASQTPATCCRSLALPEEGAGPNAPQAHHGSMEARCWLISGTIATDRNMATHGPSPDLTAKSDQSPSRASL